MKQYFPFLFFIVFIGILIGANVYLTRRFNWYFSIESTKVLYAVFPPLTLLMFFGVMPLSNTTNLFGSFVYIISALTMGVFLYLFLSVALVEIVRIFTSFEPKTYGLFAIAITVLVTGGGVINAWNIQVTKQEIELRSVVV